MKPTRSGRMSLVGVKITAVESEALDWEVRRRKEAGNRRATRSSIIYEMAERGGLSDLVALYRASISSGETDK